MAYLVVEGGPYSRQTLAELLWPDRSNAQALSSLRFALSKVRTLLHDRHSPQPLLLVGRSQVELNPRADLWVDVTAFSAQAAACEAQAGQNAAISSETIQAALGLYRGDFLQTLSLDVGLNFETWALSKREQLSYQRLRLLELLAQSLESAGQCTQAETAYRRILAEQPWNEAIHRSLMKLLVGAGRAAAALVQYEACRLALHELGIDPGRETNYLVKQIKLGEAALDGSIDASCQEPEAAPFVAREAELERLDQFLRRALAGRGQVVLVTGEAGSGKTAMLKAFAQRALGEHPGLLAAGGQCDAYMGIGQPYQPFIECVQMLVGGWDLLPWAERLPDDDHERLQQALPGLAQALVEVAPALLDRFVDRAELVRSLQAASGGQRTRPAWQRPLSRPAPRSLQPLEAGLLLEQVSRFLLAAARQHPLLLLLDDLHWADPGSAALLFHLSRRLAASRIMVLAAYRPGEITGRQEGGQKPFEQHPLAACLTEIQRQAGDVLLDLDHPADERGFVAALLAQDPQLQPNHLDRAFCTILARRTGGNPLFTLELLHSMQARGDLLRSPQGAWESRPDLEWSHLPERVEAAIASRLVRLAPQWRDWLSTASVAGESFTAEALAQVHGLPAEMLLRTLNGPLGMGGGALRLVQAEYVQWVRAPGSRLKALSRYRFGHVLFQTYLYQQLNPVERSRRHAALGAALEELLAGQPEMLARHANDLARHFELGGLPEKAAAYYLLSGQQAVSLAATPTAAAHYRHGLDLLDALPESPERRRLQFSLSLGLSTPYLVSHTGAGAGRQQMSEYLLEMMPDLGDADVLMLAAGRPGVDQWPALYLRVDQLFSMGDLEPARRLGEQMLSISGPQDYLLQALAHRTLGLVGLLLYQIPEARRHLEMALEAYAAIRWPASLVEVQVELEASIRAMLGMLLAISGYPDQGWAQAALALERTRSLPRPPFLGLTLVLALEVALLRGDLAAAQALAGEVLELGQATGGGYYRCTGLAAQGYVQVLRSQPGSSEGLAGLDLIQQGLKLWEAVHQRLGYRNWLVRQAHACLLAGRMAGALDITQGILEADSNKPDPIVAQALWLRGLLLLRQDPPDAGAAQAALTQALEIARMQGAKILELNAAVGLARLWQPGQPEAARRLLEETCAWFSEGQSLPAWREAQALLAADAAGH